jgi:hypothetical protein
MSVVVLFINPQLPLTTCPLCFALRHRSLLLYRPIRILMRNIEPPTVMLVHRAGVRLYGEGGNTEVRLF